MIHADSGLNAPVGRLASMPSPQRDAWTVARPVRRDLSPAAIEALYVQQGLSSTDVARALDTTPSRVIKTMVRHGIPRRQWEPLGRDQLEELYVTLGLSSTDVAEKLATTPSRVLKALARYGIPRRTRGTQGTAGRSPPNKDLLEQRFLVDGESIERIAADLGYRPASVRLALTRHGISRRRDWRRSAHPGLRRHVDREVLEDLYVHQGLTMAQVGARLGVSVYVVSRRLHEYALPVRPGGLPGTREHWPEITLLERVYADDRVRRVLARHNIPRREQPGPLDERFPDQAFLVPLTKAVLSGLYIEAGMSPTQIELVTGRSARMIRDHLHELGIPLRPGGQFAPLTRRIRKP